MRRLEYRVQEDRAQSDYRRDERRSAWSAAKLAVRSYARDPSDANARQVRRAWLKVRRATTTAIDQRIDRQLERTPPGTRIGGP